MNIPDPSLLEQENLALQSMLTIHKAQFIGIFDTSAIGMALVSIQGHWIKVNDSLLRIFGYSREQLHSKTFQDITHPDDLAADLHLLQELLDGHKTSYQIEKRYFNHQGEIIWALLAVSIVKDKNNEPLHFVSQIIDITATKRMAHLHLSQADKQNTRIAFELHENIAQTVASVKLFLNSTGAGKAYRPDTLTLVDDRLAQLIRDITALSEQIMPNTFIHENLFDLLQGLTVKYGMKYNVEAEINIDKTLKDYHVSDGLLIYRIVDELWQVAILMDAQKIQLFMKNTTALELDFSFHTKHREQTTTVEQNILCSNILMRVEMLGGTLDHHIEVKQWSWRISIPQKTTMA